MLFVQKQIETFRARFRRKVNLLERVTKRKKNFGVPCFEYY